MSSSVWTFFLAATLAACTATAPSADSRPGAPANQSQAIQTLIKFKDVTLRVDDGLLNGLGQRVGASINYVRAMSGDAHVVRITPRGADSYPLVLIRLRAAPEVEYVEPDAVMRTPR